MKILIAKANQSEETELRDYFQTYKCEVYAAVTKQAIFQILAGGAIEAVLYCLSNLDDFSIIRYINKTYPAVRVVIVSDSGLCTTIDNVRYGVFTSLKHPYHLNQLNSLFCHSSEQKRNGYDNGSEIETNSKH
jgi:DNA-binding NtrC family response regulator